MTALDVIKKYIQFTVCYEVVLLLHDYETPFERHHDRAQLIPLDLFLYFR
jgi:hypothetical protein